MSENDDSLSVFDILGRAYICPKITTLKRGKYIESFNYLIHKKKFKNSESKINMIIPYWCLDNVFMFIEKHCWYKTKINTARKFLRECPNL